MFATKKTAPGLVKIKLLQGVVGHRTREIPAGTKTVKQTLADGTVADVLVKTLAETKVLAEFAFERGDIVEWAAEEAKKMQARDVCEILEAA